MRPALAGAMLGLSVAMLGVSAARADDLGGDGFGIPTALPWSEARERLLVQLRLAQDSGAPNAIFRQDIPYTRTALVLAPDDPAAEPDDVTLADALAWNKTGEELFEIAIGNLERRYPPDVRETPELPRDVKLHLFYGEHRYGAGYALSITSHRRCMGKRGSLVVVANQHAMLCYPVESSRAFHAYLALVNMSADIVATGENPLVPHVYWYHRGVWEPQLVTMSGKRFSHQRTPGFEALMKDLSREGPRERRF